MAHIEAEERDITPIYFQMRRESKWTIPPVALPPEQDSLRLATVKELIGRNMLTVEAAKELFSRGLY